MLFDERVALIAEMLGTPLTAGPVTGAFNTPMFPRRIIEAALFLSSLAVLRRLSASEPMSVLADAYVEATGGTVDGNMRYIPLPSKPINIISVTVNDQAPTEGTIAAGLQRADFEAGKTFTYFFANSRMYFTGATSATIRYIKSPTMADWQANADVLPTGSEMEAIRMAYERVILLEQAEVQDAQ